MNDSPNPDTSVSPSPFSSFKDKFVFPTSRDFWPSFSFPTPPTSPVKFCIDSQAVTKEVRWHAASGPWGQMKEISDDELEDLDFPFEFPREACEPRAESPAILNDIMWSGDRIKRPDSTTDFEERFSLSSTPTCLEHPISHTFVEPEELFSFSLLEQAHEHPDDHFQQRLERVGAITDSLGKEHSSESDEEIDVVGLADKTQEGKSTGSDGSTYTRKNANRPPRKLRSKRSNGEISEQESEGESARASHNDLERKRRNDLRNRFQCLRKSIPSLKESERAAKITILRRASELIPALQEEEETLIAIKESEKKKNAELLSTLMRLAKNKRV